jgi:arylsulfatase
LGRLERQPGHLIDIMATCVDVAGVAYPETARGLEVLPLEGVSLRPAFAGRSLKRPDALYFEHHLNSAVRDGRWKLVRKGDTGEPRVFEWELYDMETDRTELYDLAEQYPQKVAELVEKWEIWARRANVKPWPWEIE